jgi:hypothetical protein
VSDSPTFESPRTRVAEPIKEPPKPEPAPYVAGDIGYYILTDYRQFPGEQAPRPPGSIMGCVQCDAAIDHLWLVDAIRKGIISRKQD